MSCLLSLQPCCPHGEYIHSVRVACVQLAFFFANNPGIFIYCCSRTLLSSIVFIKNSSKYFVLIHSWPAAVRYVLNMSPVKDYPLVIRFILSCLILCLDIYLHIHGTTAACLSCHAVLSILSKGVSKHCLLYTSPSPRDKRQSRMPSSA